MTDVKCSRENYIEEWTTLGRWEMVLEMMIMETGEVMVGMDEGTDDMEDMTDVAAGV